MKQSLFFGFILSLIFVGAACKNNSVENTDIPKTDIFCNAETMDQSGFNLLTTNPEDSAFLSLGGDLSVVRAKSGKKSVKISQNKPFALTYELRSLKGNERFRVSVWRYDPSGKSALVVAADKSYLLYAAQKMAIEKDENGWERLEIVFDVPPAVKFIKIYAWRIDSDSAWFDDMHIQEIPAKTYPNYANQKKLHLYFDEDNWRILDSSRNRAFENGILEQAESDWAEGILSDEQDVLPISARLKGDWLDHLVGNKWSFRIKMRKSKVYHQWSVFSIQNPATRSFLDEYVAHELFAFNDLLTTQYEFIPVYINGESRGVYAVEEHFAKQLVEHNNRRQGPISRLNDEAFWSIQKYGRIEKKWYIFPFFQSSIAEPFQENKTLAISNSQAEFEIAQSMIYQYKEHKIPMNQIFDIDKLAKYWALIDLTKGRHGIAWHNQRFYYNPVLCLLEPIAFDLYSSEKETTVDNPIIGNIWFPEGTEFLPDKQLVFRIFQDREFQWKYLEYLQKYSDETYLKSFFDQREKSIVSYEALLKTEFINYQYTSDFIFENARQIRKELATFKIRLQNGDINSFAMNEKQLKFDTVYRPDLVSHLVNAFYSKSADGKSNLLIENYYSRAIELIALTDENDKTRLSISRKANKINAFRSNKEFLHLQLNSDSLAKKLAFRVEGKAEVLYAPLHLWKKNTEESPRQQLFQKNDYWHSGLFVENADTLIVKQGNHSLNQVIIVPEGRFLKIEKGVQLNMINSAAILSFSPISFLGTKENPIRIFSSDSSGMGISVFQSGRRNTIEHTQFYGLRNFSFKGWKLTGSLNFYEANVDFNHVQFESNHCEDALNIIRSEFTMNDVTFSNISGDAFDGDFVKGSISNSQFSKIGNDAVDFSGSQVQIEFCKMDYIGDKAVSAGEHSEVILNRLFITNATIGMASKDLSMINANEVSMKNCRFGIVAFQKKEEFGSAKIQARTLSFDNVITKYLIENESVLYLNSKKIVGFQKNLSRQFYEKE